MSMSGPDPGTDAAPGSHHYRAWVGATQTYDLFSHMQFSLMTLLGLRENHALLDIGCGSLRGGKLFVMYLLPDRYFGIEPHEWVVKEGIARELGSEVVRLKRPRFEFGKDFPCSKFQVPFDFILAQSIFSHASLTQVRRCLSEANAAMKSTSLFVGSFLEGDQDYDGESWVYPACVPYRLSTIERVSMEVGLRCRRLDWFHSGGQTWCVFHRPAIEPRVDLLASLNQAAMLKEELQHYRMRSERLARMESHWLFRLALRISRFCKGRERL